MELHDDLEPDDLTSQWKYIECFHDELYAICNRTARYNESLAEELMHDVVYSRLWRILELYDASKGPLTNYVNKNVKLYCYKHVQIAERRRMQGLPEHDERCYTENHDAAIEVSILLDGLTDYERQLFVAHYAYGTSCRELARGLGTTHPQISRQLTEIMNKIRDGFPDNS